MSKLTFTERELKQGLKDLIRIDSSNPQGNERAVAEYLANILRSEQITFRELLISEQRSCLVAHWPAQGTSTSKRALIFCGHMDVVPVRDDELKKWHYDPWEALEVDGRIYGRGACDMKSGLWASFYAFVRAKELSLDFDLYFVATCDEEDTMLGIHAVIDSGILPQQANVIICEPTSLKLASASRGRSWWEVEISGQASHGSQRDMGLNAIYPAVDLIQSLESEDFLDHNTSGATFWQALEIQAGLKPCVVPNVCKLTIDARIGLADTCQSIISAFEDHICTIKQRYPQAGFDYTVVDRREPWQASPDETLLQLLRNNYSLEEFCFTGSTDGNPLRSAGHSVLIIGPGDLAQAHHSDEYVQVAELYAAEALYGEIIKLYCQASQSLPRRKNPRP